MPPHMLWITFQPAPPHHQFMSNPFPVRPAPLRLTQHRPPVTQPRPSPLQPHHQPTPHHHTNPHPYHQLLATPPASYQTCTTASLAPAHPTPLCHPPLHHPPLHPRPTPSRPAQHRPQVRQPRTSPPQPHYQPTPHHTTTQNHVHITNFLPHHRPATRRAQPLALHQPTPPHSVIPLSVIPHTPLRLPPLHHPPSPSTHTPGVSIRCVPSGQLKSHVPSSQLKSHGHVPPSHGHVTPWQWSWPPIVAIAQRMRACCWRLKHGAKRARARDMAWHWRKTRGSPQTH